LAVLGTLALTAVNALACGDTESESGTIKTFDDLLQALADDVCRGNCDQNSATYFEIQYGAECAELMPLVYESIGATLQASLDAGKMGFDAEQAQRCIDLRAAKACDEAESACDAVFIGHVPVGEACSSSEECADNAYCNDEEMCPGTCVATLSPGAACEYADFDECGDGRTCSEEGVCIVQKANGEPCVSSDECQSWRCDEGGHCAEFPPDYTQDLGEPCDYDENCKLDLYCHEGTCAPAAALGESCEGYTPCVSTAYCELEDDSAYETCVKRIPVGGACDDSDKCATGVCDAGKCQELSGLGGPCSSNERCFGVCDDGACAPYPACDE